MRRTIFAALALLWGNVAMAVVILAIAEDRTLFDAFLTAMSTVGMSTVGFGEFSFEDSNLIIKTYAIVLMLTGPLTIAIIVTALVDFVLSEHLAALMGRRRSKMENHIVVCGVGQLGMRVVGHLRKDGKDVAAIELTADGGFVEACRELGAEVHIGDARSKSMLEQVHLTEADAIVVMTDSDLANLEIAVHAREICPDIRVVLRMFDAHLAESMEAGFDIHTVFSPPALAAPAFAMAALDSRKSIINSFFVDEDLIVTSRLHIEGGSPFSDMTLADFQEERHAKVISYRAFGEAASVLPPGDTTIRVGDELVIVVENDRLEPIHEANEQAAHPWRLLAEELEGEFKAPDWVAAQVPGPQERLTFQMGPWPVTIERVDRGSTGSQTIIQAKFQTPDEFEFDLRDRQTWLGDFDGQPLEHEYPDLGREFLVKTNDPEKLNQFLENRNIRELIQEEVPLLRIEWNTLRTTDSGGQAWLEFREVGMIEDLDRLRRILKLFDDSLQQLQRIAAGENDQE